jgi:hypothetical protein
MKFSLGVRLAAAMVYVGLTVFLFDSVASLSRPSGTAAEAPGAKESVVVATAVMPVQR